MIFIIAILIYRGHKKTCAFTECTHSAWERSHVHTKINITLKNKPSQGFKTRSHHNPHYMYHLCKTHVFYPNKQRNKQTPSHLFYPNKQNTNTDHSNSHTTSIPINKTQILTSQTHTPSHLFYPNKQRNKQNGNTDHINSHTIGGINLITT